MEAVLVTSLRPCSEGDRGGRAVDFSMGTVCNSSCLTSAALYGCAAGSAGGGVANQSSLVARVLESTVWRDFNAFGSGSPDSMGHNDP